MINKDLPEKSKIGMTKGDKCQTFKWCQTENYESHFNTESVTIPLKVRGNAFINVNLPNTSKV